MVRKIGWVRNTWGPILSSVAAFQWIVPSYHLSRKFDHCALCSKNGYWRRGEPTTSLTRNLILQLLASHMYLKRTQAQVRLIYKTFSNPFSVQVENTQNTKKHYTHFEIIHPSLRVRGLEQAERVSEFGLLEWVEGQRICVQFELSKNIWILNLLKLDKFCV